MLVHRWYSLTLFCNEISALSAVCKLFLFMYIQFILFYRGTNQVSLVGTKPSSLFTRSIHFFLRDGSSVNWWKVNPFIKGCHDSLFSFLVSARQPTLQDFTIGRCYNKGRQPSYKSVRKMTRGCTTYVLLTTKS